MFVIVDGNAIPCMERCTVVLEGITGPVDQNTNDQVHLQFFPASSTINIKVKELNTPTTAAVEASYGTTTAQTLANLATTPG